MKRLTNGPGMTRPVRRLMARSKVNTSSTKEQANLVGSLCGDGLHRPVIDIDFPCRLVPSSTEGHFHLYVELSMHWEQYERLLVALAQAGIISAFYLKAAQIRGQTFVRPEWVKKEKEDSVP